ncbi:MAG TPA: VCBS repeat-containing protein, partial [Planctomycetota bacterium]|nr:VCBS repeat-containing protein [Planctomycetota bacterium]
MRNALLALALWSAATCFAGAVTYHSLNLAGEADNGIFAEDLTGNGRFDLIGLAAGRIAIFRADPAQQSGYSPTPEVLITGPTAYFADVADVVPDKGKEILILTPDGVWAFVQADGRFNPRPRPLIRCETILSLNTLRSGIAAQYQPNVQVLPWNFAFDANGDGLDDVLVPHDKGTDVYLQKPAGQFAKPITLSLFPIVHHFAAPGHKADEFHQTTSRSARLQMVVPSLESRDVNGDGKPDLISGPYWFAQKLDGTFDTTAAHLPPDRQSQVAPNIRIVDINGDKRPDRFTEENVMDDPLNIVTRVRVFLADA